MRQDDVLLKWTGSKRLSAPQIVRHFPTRIETYYEPFVGGGSILYTLIDLEWDVERYCCSDANLTLIQIWLLVKENPRQLLDAYEQLWPFDSYKYYKIRDEFNEDQDPAKLFCLLRSCRNGLVRYNSKGDFTSGFHHRRKGIRPDKLERILLHWQRKLVEKQVAFRALDYRIVSASPGDFIYLDPPYVSEDAFYSGRFEFEPFWHWLAHQKASWALSLNSDPSMVPVLYEQHEVVLNRMSKFDQLNGNDRPISHDNLYIHREEKS